MGANGKSHIGLMTPIFRDVKNDSPFRTRYPFSNSPYINYRTEVEFERFLETGIKFGFNWFPFATVLWPHQNLLSIRVDPSTPFLFTRNRLERKLRRVIPIVPQ
jgi:hypothetical protein